MGETVVFCENHGVIERTLYLATHSYPITIIILGNRDLFKFFQVINERVFHNTINLIYSEPYQAGRVTAKGLKKVFHVLPSGTLFETIIDICPQTGYYQSQLS